MKRLPTLATNPLRPLRASYTREHRRTLTNTQPRSRRTPLLGHNVTALLLSCRCEANACDEEEEEEEKERQENYGEVDEDEDSDDEDDRFSPPLRR